MNPASLHRETPKLLSKDGMHNVHWVLQGYIPLFGNLEVLGKMVGYSNEQDNGKSHGYWAHLGLHHVGGREKTKTCPGNILWFLLTTIILRVQIARSSFVYRSHSPKWVLLNPKPHVFSRGAWPLSEGYFSWFRVSSQYCPARCARNRAYEGRRMAGADF